MINPYETWVSCKSCPDYERNYEDEQGIVHKNWCHDRGQEDWQEGWLCDMHCHPLMELVV